MRQPVALLNGESSKPSIDIRRALSVCCGNTQIAMEAEEVSATFTGYAALKANRMPIMDPKLGQ